MALCACGTAVTVPVIRNVRVPAVQFGYQRNPSWAQSIWARQGRHGANNCKSTADEQAGQVMPDRMMLEVTRLRATRPRACFGLIQ